MRYLLVVLLLLSATPAAASPLMMWAAMGRGIYTQVDSFETGNDGWALSGAVRTAERAAFGAYSVSVGPASSGTLTKTLSLAPGTFTLFTTYNGTLGTSTCSYYVDGSARSCTPPNVSWNGHPYTVTAESAQSVTVTLTTDISCTMFVDAITYQAVR